MNIYKNKRAITLIFALNASVLALLAGPGNARAEGEAPAAIPADVWQLVQNKDWKSVTPRLEQLVKQDAGNAQAHYWLGKSLCEAKKYRDAKPELQQVLRLAHGTPLANDANNLLLTLPRDTVAPKRVQMQAKVNGHRVAAAGFARPTIISFYAKWADPCKQLQVDLDKAKSEFGERVEISSIDVDDPKNQKLMEQYDVSPIPTIIILDDKGKVINFLIGYNDPAELEDNIKKVLNK